MLELFFYAYLFVFYCFHISLTALSYFCLNLLTFFFCFVIQLDICKEMANICARTSTKHTLQLFDSFCMACCHFPYSCSARVGKHPYYSSGKEHNWFSCYNGGCCFASVILLYNALVENTMAKLKYAIFALS